MQQGDEDDDDGYYDDDDYYDDEDSGPSPLVLVVVGVALLMGLGAAGLAGYIFVERSKSEVPESVSTEESTEAVTEPEANGDGSAGGSGGVVPDETEVGEERDSAERADESSWRSENGESWTPSSRAERRDEDRRTASASRSSDRSDDGGAGARGNAYRAPPSQRGSASRNERTGSSGGTSLRSQSSGSASRRGQRDDSASERRREIVGDRGSDAVDWSDGGAEERRPGEIVGGTSASSPSPPRSYEKAEIKALGSAAGSGSLDRDDIDHLKEVPANHKNFTLAWSTVLKDAESKENYRDHCSAAQRIMSLPQNKYHPEWNLEMAKCHMRNGQWSAAVRSVDRTLSDSFGMSGATKSKRVLLAHKILAISKTQLYEKNAESNAGLSDDAKLRSAIQAWEHYKTFARGIGNTAALQRADKELADLEGKMN